MDAIDTRTIEQGGSTYRIRIYADEDAGNPLEEWCEMGIILSLNRRHINFDPGGIEAAIESNADAVPLAYYEHGRCLWCVAGELPAAASCQWDSVDFAGLWLPDTLTLESARSYRGKTRRRFLRERARQACDVYTLWCNGEVYGYEIERLTTCDDCQTDRAEPIGSCWGFFGFDACLSEAMAAIL